MPIAILDEDAECPECGHFGAWSQTLIEQSQPVERFQCQACDAKWGGCPVTTPDSVSLDVPVDNTERTLVEATPRHVRARWKTTKTPSPTRLER